MHRERSKWLYYSTDERTNPIHNLLDKLHMMSNLDSRKEKSKCDPKIKEKAT